jgi:hypothetical protein
MRKLWSLAVVVWLAALPARVDAQFFFDPFDSYITGSNIGGQGGWELWDNNPGVDTIVTNARAFNPPNSLLIAGAADIVHQFEGVTSGVWFARALVYIPSTHTGETFFILLNQYEPSGVQHWSIQVVFCITGCTNGVPGMVTSLGGSDGGGGGVAPLITDRWVEIRTAVDLDANTYELFYGGTSFETGAWTVTGSMAIDTMDLFSNGANESYIDHAWLDTTLPMPTILRPPPAVTGSKE